MRRTALLLAFTLLAAPQLARADDTETFVHAVGLYKAGNFTDAAREFFDLANGPKGTTRQQSEYYLAEAFFGLKLYQSALSYYGQILDQGASHPKYADALVGLVKVDEALADDVIIPSRLNKEYDQASNVLGGKEFPQDVLLKINYIVGRVNYEKGRYDDALSFLETVTAESPYFARAQYLRGVVLARTGKQNEAGIAFEKVLDIKADKVRYLEAQDLHDLALLGAARVAYGTGDYAKSVKYFESVPRFSRFWDQALFENGWARFQNEDLGGSLGSLQALHSPQFEGSFQPESWILSSTVYFFSCLYDEAKFALKSYENIYLPMSAKIQPLLEGDHDNEFFARLLDGDKAEQLPPAVRNYLLANSRLVGFRNYLTQLDAEKGQVAAIGQWRSSPIATELQQGIDAQRQLLTQVTGKFVKERLADVVSTIKGFEGQVAILRFETTKAEKEVLETNTNIGERLGAQNLKRPRMPAEDWEYWSFQGEFWIDEIGYYQYTLKSGCAASKTE
jgi:TolA-binding protein